MLIPQNNQSSSKENKVILTEISQSFSGPLPPPDILRQFDEVVPGAAERIIKMAEDQSLHRRSLEAKVIHSGVTDSKRGLWFGLIMGLSGFGLVGFCASLGLQLLAGIIAALDLGSLVGVFVYGSRQKKAERVEKERAVQEDR